VTKEYVVAGQAAPAADTDHELYAVPAGNSFVASTLTVANRDKTGDAAEYRVAIVPDGETLAAKHYIKFDEFLDRRESVPLTLGLSLPAGCKVFVRASTANLSFSLFGVKISAA
jgi:hypothetical protein